ncbi:MAG: DUF1573 domain-containing protein [Flavobacterium sp.]|uniref:DUF1573 domain-containing protein n=1 Tax=Flavobacterium celericrescens TaxID=2709780 RepID=A0ABX0IDQ3_9FLAO|nr:DUF1573 domain-containing protein [Flavobacterium celericrescens]NHM04742.1 DUF1573 domain-containing protein [Flavobacterium celericrescens]
MMKKSIGFLALSVVLMTTSCKQESAADKITDADMKALEAEKALGGKLPKVKLDKLVHDFGTINEGDKVETEFIVTNDGEADLVIAEAKGSCGCTVPQPPKDPIKPGDSAPIKVSFNSQGKPGAQEKTVTLTTNTENGHETFQIKANVTPKAGIAATNK